MPGYAPPLRPGFLVVTVLGTYLIAFGLIAGWWLVELWPRFERADNEQYLLLAVLLAGAIGSYVHTVHSFATFVGNREFHRSWMWWYILRPFSGAALAFIFYLIARGSLIGMADGKALNPYGITAFAGLSGLYSKQAIDKLEEVFDSMFHRRKQVRRKDELSEEEREQNADQQSQRP